MKVMNNFYQWEAQKVQAGQVFLKFFDMSGFQTIGLGSFSYDDLTGALKSFSANFTTAKKMWSWQWDSQGGGNASIYLRRPTWNFEEGQPHFANRRQDGQSDLWQFFTTYGNEAEERYLELIFFGSNHPFLLCSSTIKNRGLLWIREEEWFRENYASNTELLSA